MNKFFKDIKSSATNFGKILEQKTEELSAKTEEIVEVQKIKTDIRVLERQNLHNCLDLGEIIYEKYESGEALSTEIIEICKEIEGRISMLEALEQDIAIIKGEEVSYSSQVNYRTREAYPITVPQGEFVTDAVVVPQEQYVADTLVSSHEEVMMDQEFQVEYTYDEGNCMHM